MERFLQVYILKQDLLFLYSVSSRFSEYDKFVWVYITLLRINAVQRIPVRLKFETKATPKVSSFPPETPLISK